MAYACWLLIRWLYGDGRVDPATGLWLVLAGLLCLAWLLLGTVAPARWVVSVWTVIGKGLLYLLMLI